MKTVKQRGSALFISLMLLIVMTLIGVTAMQTTVMQERMAGNVRDNNLAFQAAEAALRDGEEFLRGATLPNFNGTNGLYQLDLEYPPLWADIDWDDDGRVYGNTLDGVAATPRYIIEELPAVVLPGESLAADEPAPEAAFFRVTARGVGGSDVSIVILQSTFRR